MNAAAHKSSQTPTPPSREAQEGGGAVAGSALARPSSLRASRAGVGEGGGGNERERRDIVSGTVLPENRLVRFAAAPDGTVVPDVAAKLPGRGLWVEATRDAVNKAVEKKLFSRAAKMQVIATADLADRVEKALVTRMIGDLGIARRAGRLVLGFDNVLRELQGPKPPKALIEAHDGAADGKRKLYAAAHRLELNCAVIESLTSAELGLALGRENVIHAAVQPGGFSDRLTFDAERLSGFRQTPNGPGPKAPRAQPRGEKVKS